MDVDAVIAGMSEGERVAVIRARPHACGPDNTLLPVFRDGGRVWRSLVNLGLCELVHLGCRLTEKGKAVRARLEQDNG